MNITEDYVSYEVAKLLKEKEFDEPCRTYYEDKKFVDDVCTQYYQWNSKSPFGHISAPTHQMAMKWLREVHNIAIVIKPEWAKVDMQSSVMWRWKIVDTETIQRDYNGVIYQFSYEEAVEAALFYTLENLI